MATPQTHPIIGVHRLAGRSTAINRVRSLIQQFASANVPVIVSGETGVGKEVVARALHEEGIRARAPFEVHNCSALRGELLNSALFGHEKGAFTGATATMKGIFERAGAGTLFLDEVAELPKDTQAILLRAIEGHPYLPVGFQRKLVFRGRLVVATHASLAERVECGDFRYDLYFRLRGTTIDIPPLRERPEDIELLTEALLNDIGLHLSFSADAFAWAAQQPWPGNVRELRQLLSQVAVLHAGETIDASILQRCAYKHPSSLPPSGVRSRASLGNRQRSSVPPGSESRVYAARVLDQPRSGEPVTDRVLRSLYHEALERAQGNVSEAGRLLQMDRRVLSRELLRLRVEPRKK